MSDERDKLEPPSLFGRKRKKPRPEPAVPAPPPAASAVEEPTQPIAAPYDESPSTVLDDVPEPTRAEPARSPLSPPPAPAEAAEPAAPAEPRPPREPWLLGQPAAVVTGLLVGALIVAGTAGSLRLCTAAKGTSSCGGPGFFLLVAILVVAVLVGAGLLRAARVPQPGSTSFLAVGLLSVVALLFLVGQIFEWWMVIVIPLVSVATFLLSHWVTTTYIEPEADGVDAERQPESYDIR